jgi:hypothetical protein
MIVYDIGDAVRVSGAFADASGVATDPTTLTLIVLEPSATETPYVYGEDAEVVRDSAGAFHFDLTLTAAGTWLYRWVATGAVTAAVEGFVKVRQSQFAAPLP